MIVNASEQAGGDAQDWVSCSREIHFDVWTGIFCLEKESVTSSHVTKKSYSRTIRCETLIKGTDLRS